MNGGTYTLNSHSLDSVLLAPSDHILRRLRSIEVIYCNVGALLCEREADDFA